MKKRYIIYTILVGLILIAVAFYGGMQYDAKNVQEKFAEQQQGRAGGNFGGGANGGQRAVGGGQRANMQAGIANGGAGDFTNGDVIAKDDISVTIKTRDGGSKIIFFSDKTSIDKSVSGSTSDLNVGQQITINGKTSSDGTITAQNIQIRPIQQK